MQFFQPVQRDKVAFEFEVIMSRLEGLLQPGWWDEKEEVAQLFGLLGRDYLAIRHLLQIAINRNEIPPLQGAQSFIVHDSAAFGIRLNLWFPEKTEVTSEKYRKYLSIEQMHNHDFDFFTMCVSGPGYSSQFWRDADHSHKRERGEKLTLEQPRMIRLEKGPVLFVEKDLDYHSQQWPVSFTTTLNLIPKHSADEKRVQYLVDSETHTILEVVQGSG